MPSSQEPNGLHGVGFTLRTSFLHAPGAAVANTSSWPLPHLCCFTRWNRQAWSAAQASTLGQAPQVRWWRAQVPTGELMPFGKTVLRTEVLNVQALGQQLQYLLPTDPPRNVRTINPGFIPDLLNQRGRNPAKPAGDSDFCRSLRIGVIPNLHKREKVLPVPRSST